MDACIKYDNLYKANCNFNLLQQAWLFGDQPQQKVSRLVSSISESSFSFTLWKVDVALWCTRADRETWNLWYFFLYFWLVCYIFVCYLHIFAGVTVFCIYEYSSSLPVFMSMFVSWYTICRFSAPVPNLITFLVQMNATFFLLFYYFRIMLYTGSPCTAFLPMPISFFDAGTSDMKLQTC